MAWLHTRREFGDGTSMSRDVAYRALLDCSKRGDLELGRLLYLQMINNGLDSVTVLANHIIRFFSSCGTLIEANQAFSKVSLPDQYTWNAIFDAHSKLGEGHLALGIYAQMQDERDRYTFFSVLKVCRRIGAMEHGYCIHEQIIKSRLESDILVGNTLIDLYIKSSKLDEARKVFDRLTILNVVSWGAMIAGYVQHGRSYLALECYKNMEHATIEQDQAIFVSVLKACSMAHALEKGRFIHEKIIASELQIGFVMDNVVIDMYAKCGSLEEAVRAFNKLPNQNEASQTAMLNAFGLYGEHELVLKWCDTIQHVGLQPSKGALLSRLKACGSIHDIVQGRYIHEQIIGMELQHDIVVSSTLLDMYSKCGTLLEACRVFCSLRNPDIIAWGAMIAGYARHNQGIFALEHFFDMQRSGIMADKVTYLSILKACKALGNIEQGRCIHENIIEDGFHPDNFINNTLIDFYAKTGCLEEACTLFNRLTDRDIVSWNAMLAGYSEHGEDLLALQCFERLQQEGLNPSKIIFLSILKTCSNLNALEQGRYIHDHIVETGLQSDIVGCALIDMYVRCGTLEEAQSVFDNFPIKNVGVWSAMIAAYVQHFEDCLALQCFDKMQIDQIKPDKVTFLSVLKACSNTGAIEQGRYIHKKIMENGLQTDIVVGSTIIHMYAKCGSLGDARKVFDMLLAKDVVSWCAMVSGYAQASNVRMAVECFKSMQNSGIMVDDITYRTILTAFRYAGMVDEALWFVILRGCDDIMLDIDHITGMVDLLAHAGHFSEAEDLVQATHVQPDVCLWMTLLNACHIYCNVELGRRCFDVVIRLDPSYAAAYVLISNIYANALNQTK